MNLYENLRQYKELFYEVYEKEYIIIIKIFFFIFTSFFLFQILNKIIRNFIIVITFKKEFFVFIFSIFLSFYIFLH